MAHTVVHVTYGTFGYDILTLHSPDYAMLSNIHRSHLSLSEDVSMTTVVLVLVEPELDQNLNYDLRLH